MELAGTLKIMSKPKNLAEALEFIGRLRTTDKQSVDATLIPNLSIKLEDLMKRDWVREIPLGRATLNLLGCEFTYVCELVSNTSARILWRQRAIGPKKMTALEQILTRLGLQLGYHLEKEGSW